MSVYPSVCLRFPVELFIESFDFYLIDYRGISLRRTHHEADTLYKAEKDFAPNLQLHGQNLLKPIAINRALP